ncbi:MAG: phosphodiester glycosidase family protein [Kiritimatiellae bacterium]|nr:phosphodiester glycosidase family protein [Kiritimatiellia bacterium]
MTKCILAAVAVATAFHVRAGTAVLSGADAVAKFPAQLRDSDAAKLADARWCELLPGVEYFYGKFLKLYNKGREDVSVIRVDYRKAKVRMEFVDNRANGGGNRKTSDVAGRRKALFGVNCTFPMWYAKMDGKVVKDGHKEGGLALNDDKTYEFFDASWWKKHPNGEGWTDVFSTEALGLLGGRQTLDGVSWGSAPYTFMGEATNGVLCVCVVDGRTPRSEGMGYGTVHTFLRAFGCFNGMCLDGGGSTTMVVRKDLLPAGVNELQHVSEGSAAHWTMNHTIDNILGRERKVCNQLLFVAEGD